MTRFKDAAMVVATIALFFIGFGLIVGLLTRLLCFGFWIAGGHCA